MYVDESENVTRHALVFIFGNKNYGRIQVNGAEINATDLYLAKEVGIFRGMKMVDQNQTNILIEGYDD